MKKVFLFLGIIVITFCSCGRVDEYKVKIERYYDKPDTVIVSIHPNCGIIKKLYINKYGCLSHNCNLARDTKYCNVKSFKLISKIHKKQTPKKSFKEYNLSLKKYIPTFLYIISFLFVILFYIKSKSSIMKTITKYTVYGILVILLIKIGIVLVKYLPPFIELLLK